MSTPTHPDLTDRRKLARWISDGWSLAQIGREVGRHEDTVSYWVRKHGLKPSGRARHAAIGGIDRPELTRAVLAGLTIAELAETFNVEKGTVRYWLDRYGLRTVRAAGSRAEAWR